MIIPYSVYVPFPERENEIDYTAEISSVSGLPCESVTLTRFLITGKADRSVHVSFEGTARVKTRCARCLTDVTVTVSFAGERTVNSETHTDEEGETVDCFTEAGFDSDEFIAEEIASELPIRTLCKENCKGLCPVCGKNLNEGECGCRKQTAPNAIEEALRKALGSSDRKSND